MNQPMASVSLIAVHPSGERTPASIEIGTPYFNEQWRCPVALPGLHNTLMDIGGEDSLQSLCLALRLVQSLLRHFVATGGKLIEAETGKTFRLRWYFSKR